MDLESKDWSRKTVYLTKDSIKLLKDLAYFTDETQTYVLNKLIQEKVPKLLEEIVK